MGKTTAILIAATAAGAIVYLILGRHPAEGAGCFAGLAMVAIVTCVFIIHPGYRWATTQMGFSPLAASIVGPLVYLSGAVILFYAGLLGIAELFSRT